MAGLKIDLKLPVLPQDHPVIMVRPGRGYHLHGAFLRNEVVAPDFPFLDLDDGASPSKMKEAGAQLGRAIEFRDWAMKSELERGLAPPVALERYATFHEDRGRMRTMLQAAASEILWDLPDHALIFVPAPNLEGKAMTGELAPHSDERVRFNGAQHRKKIEYLGRKLCGVQKFPMRILPTDVTEAPRLSGLTVFEFEGYARERLLRARYGDYQLGSEVAMMEFIADNERFDARAVARLAAISDIVDHYLRTGDINHPGMFLFDAQGVSGAEIHARINSKGGRLLVEAGSLAPHMLKALILVAAMQDPVSGQELETAAQNDAVAVVNSTRSHAQDDTIAEATSNSLRDFARTAGVANLDVILRTLRETQEVTEGDIDGTAERTQ